MRSYPFHGRRLSRAFAVETIYNHELTFEPLERIFHFVVNERREYFENLKDKLRGKHRERVVKDLENWEKIVDYGWKIVQSYRDNSDYVDELLRENLGDFNYDRIFAVERAIIKSALSEMIALGTHYRIVISEAIELAKRYSGERAIAVVNAILDKVVDSLGLKKDESRNNI